MVEAQKEKEELKTSYFTWGLFAQDHEYEGMKKGIEKGIEKKAIEATRNLLAMGVGTHEQIAKAIGLPLETVEQLAQEIALGKNA